MGRQYADLPGARTAPRCDATRVQVETGRIYGEHIQIRDEEELHESELTKILNSDSAVRTNARTGS